MRKFSVLSLSLLMISTVHANSNKVITPSISGTWYEPKRPGHGFIINITGQTNNLTLVATWYTYNNQRQQMWLSGAAPLSKGSTRVNIPLTISTGALFGAEFNSDDIVIKPWGNLIFEFDSCDTGIARYQPNNDQFQSGSIAITRLTNTAGLECKQDPSITQKCVLTGSVTRVSDGDSITVSSNTGFPHKIRLAGIDTPELGQPYGTEAKNFLRSLIDQQQVCIEGDKLDRYNRLLGTVFLDNDNINLKIIQAGYAWHYKFYQDEQSPEDRQSFSDAEEQSRQNHRGLWIDAQPIAPWDWRKGIRSKMIPEDSHWFSIW